MVFQTLLGFLNPWIALNVIDLKYFPRTSKGNTQESIQETGRHHACETQKDPLTLHLETRL
jgi:hypothetical protein